MKQKTAKKGAPSKRTKALVDKILTMLAQGKSLRRICHENPSLPTITTIMNWLNKDKSFLEQYMRAREMGAHFLVEEIIDIADSAKDRTAVEKARVQVDARKWAASKLAPKKYGDKLDVTSGGEALNLPPPSFIIPKK